MRRRWLARLVAGVAAGMVVAGCGVPTNTGVRVDGPPREAGPPEFGADAEPPPGPDEAGSAEELVEFFLRAAATDPEHAVDVLREFIHSAERDAWQPDERVYVARVQGEEDWVVTQGDPVEFKLEVRPVGQLNTDGVVEPLTAVEKETIELAVTTERVPVEGEVGSGAERYRISGAPNAVLLDDRALERYFQPWPIYFWDTDDEKLVPDLRWLPNSVPSFARSQTVLEWLIDGPTGSWLSSAVSKLPEGLEQDGNVVPGEGTLEVRLTAPHDAVDQRQLHAQLWWTLRPDLLDDTEVTVVLNGTASALGDGHRSSNPVPAEAPASFAVLDGAIVPYIPADSKVFPELDEDLNRRVHRAAVTRDGLAAALVRDDPDGAGTLRLIVADPDGTIETELVAQDMDRPVWLNNPSGTGLVVADGSLHQFTTGDSDVAKVELDLAGEITAVAAAPDGRRLALVAGGRLYVASMERPNDVVRIGRPLWLPTTATSLDGVAFVREEWLVVMGTAGSQRALFELTVDGALERALPGADRLGTPVVTSVVGYPADPADTRSDGRGTIMYEANGQAWRYVYPQGPVAVDAAELLDDEPEPSSEDEAPKPHAPFYLD